MKYYLLCIIVAISLGLMLFKPWHKSELSLRVRSFADLPGWNSSDKNKSLRAFKLSCKAFLKQDAEKSVGSDYIYVQAKDWYPACKAALALDVDVVENFDAFFKKWFVPVEFFNKKPVQGLFTGYYMPLLHGSLTRTKKYNIPLYGMPDNIINIDLCLFDLKHKIDFAGKTRTLIARIDGKKILPFYTRAEINNGALVEKAPVIAWVDSIIERSFLEIQGSGVIALDDGLEIAVGYVGENGAPYTSIAKVLIDQGVMTRDNASMQHIRSFLKAHPQQINKVLNQNKSFVFFDKLASKFALGAQGVALTAGYSLAVDHKWVPYGTPVWLNTTRPDAVSAQEKIFQRLMIAQDTGGAIVGMVRGDVYWGASAAAATIAGRMKNPGHYWLLLPRKVAARI